MSKQLSPTDPKQWLAHVSALRGADQVSLLTQAIDLYGEKNQPLLEKGLGIADILLSLGLDNETLSSTLVYPALQANELHLDAIAEQLNEGNYKLLHDVLQMQSLSKIQNLGQRGHHQVENLRKMLLAMVTDVRAILIVLTERLWQLRHAKNLSPIEQQALANETLNVYAPLANRLGIWQLKWEIEDLCLRYLHDDIYRSIAKSIASKRADREKYIQHLLTSLTEVLRQAAIKDFQIMGRAKHIYSIYKKIQRKNTDIEKIYDMSAIRVLVPTIEDCYNVLSVLPAEWQQIPEEFDDYIAQPKINGYRSIHAVFKDPHHHYIEVQIRTHQMHQESELGVAAHWRYKEGVLQIASYEAKIALLRQIIAWQKEVALVANQHNEKAIADIFADRIYVFTPLGDIVDLPKDATPLDFAYTIHSEIGHRCRGAKINGNIVPLTYELKMGQRVEILTAKQANPSRDWLNKAAGYIKSPRVRAKIQHWFRVKDGLQQVSVQPVASAILLDKPLKLEQRFKHELTSNIYIVGVNNLLTHIALCCKPLPSDAIVGYVTRQRGVSIHRDTCKNLRAIMKNNAQRVIEAAWGC